MCLSWIVLNVTHVFLRMSLLDWCYGWRCLNRVFMPRLLGYCWRCLSQWLIRQTPKISPLKELEHDLHHTVSFWFCPYLPLPMQDPFWGSGRRLYSVTHTPPVSLGIIMGLLVGIFKMLGVMLFSWLRVKLKKLANLPQGMNWGQVIGVAALCGIGFTMSLFIGSLAFAEWRLNRLMSS